MPCLGGEITPLAVLCQYRVPNKLLGCCLISSVCVFVAVGEGSIKCMVMTQWFTWEGAGGTLISV